MHKNSCTNLEEKFIYSNWKFGELKNYYVEYSYLGENHSTMIEGTNETEIKELFKRNFDKLCVFKKAITIDDYVKEIVEGVMKGIKTDLEKTKLYKFKKSV